MKNKKLVIRSVLVVSVLSISYLGFKAAEIDRVIKQLDTQLQQAEKQLEKEEQTLEELQKERENMNTLEYIEKAAREKLGMVKSDDIVFKKK